MSCFLSTEQGPGHGRQNLLPCIALLSSLPCAQPRAGPWVSLCPGEHGYFQGRRDCIWPETMGGQVQVASTAPRIWEITGAQRMRIGMTWKGGDVLHLHKVGNANPQWAREYTRHLGTVCHHSVSNEAREAMPAQRLLPPLWRLLNTLQV